MKCHYKCWVGKTIKNIHGIFDATSLAFAWYNSSLPSSLEYTTAQKLKQMQSSLKNNLL